MNTADGVLRRAASLVTGDRRATHGDATENMGNIAALWSAYLGVPITASQVCDLNELQKIARRKTGTPNEDDYVDGAGYAALGWECRAKTDSPMESQHDRVMRAVLGTRAA